MATDLRDQGPLTSERITELQEEYREFVRCCKIGGLPMDAYMAHYERMRALAEAAGPLLDEVQELRKLA